MNAPSILIASDNAEDAKLVKRQIAEEYEQVFTTTDADASVQDFDRYKPDVLVLAFDSLGKAQQYYLGMYRLGTQIHSHPHRTVILCNKHEIRQVYELCKREYFDDYVLYWPVTHDVTRLVMAVHHAMRDLTALNANTSAMQMTNQARRLAELESLLKSNVSQGQVCVDAASQSIMAAQQDVMASLDDFSQRLSQGSFADLVEVKDAKGLQQEIGLLQNKEIQVRIQAAAESVLPIKAWATEFQQKCAPHIASAKALKTMADKMPRTILIVDDDNFARQLLLSSLSKENYELMFAASGIEALKQLSKRRADLILMSMMMPDIDGIETTRRIKSSELYSDIPIIMIASNTDRNQVIKSFNAGAVDFVAKPFNCKILLDKIRKFL